MAMLEYIICRIEMAKSSNSIMGDNETRFCIYVYIPNVQSKTTQPTKLSSKSTV